MKDTSVQHSDSVADPSVATADDSTEVHSQPSIVLRRRDDLTAQAVRAVAVFVGFYVLAVVTIIAFILAPFFVIDTLGVFSPYFVISCYGVALLIVLAIFPRPDRFTPPGPRLTVTDQPKLFETIAEVAQRTGQEMPAEVYLIAGVNAFVTQRGGIMGVGSRRVMGVGLGAMEVLNLSEFKCVLAHEFGHFYGGHLRFGPWIYQARMAMIRAADSLGEWSSWLYGPYMYYVLLFLRVTQKISRTQEFVADELAAFIYGAQRTAGSLRKVYMGSRVFSSYWEYEIAPRVRAGYRPLLVKGFVRRLQLDRVADAFAHNPTGVIGTSDTMAYDSHPSLAERLTALAELGREGEGSDVDESSAILLIDNLDRLEGLLLEHICGEHRARALKPITWEPLDREMSLDDYEELVRQHSKALRGLTPLSLTRFARNIEAFATKMVPTPGFLRRSDLDFVSFLGTKTLSAALMLALRQAGWQVQLLSSEDMLCTRGDETIEPFRVIQYLATGRLRSEALQRRCIDAGIAEIDLSTVAEQAQM